MPELTGRDRLFVALDVPTAGEARGLIETLRPDVTAFKIGWQLFISGEWKELLADLRENEVFIDLKLPGDIGRTLSAVIEFCVAERVRFLTLSDNIPRPTLRELVEARGDSRRPELLTVLFLSHLDEADFKEMVPDSPAGAEALATFMLQRAGSALEAGSDGVIASGESIRQVRERYPRATIVSPGIRPSGSATDDHKRSTTPAQAIGFGADYLVVGRPIVKAGDPRSAAQRIIEEIDRALERPKSR